MKTEIYFLYLVSATAQSQNATKKQASGRNCRRFVHIACYCTL